MRIIDLFEAPIGTIDVHNMDTRGSFGDSDRRLLSNPEHIKRLRKRFVDSDFNFNLVFLNLPGQSYVDDLEPPDDETEQAFGKKKVFNRAWDDAALSSGEVTAAKVKQMFGVRVEPDPSAITVIYTSNANVEHSIPMTPWIVAHRFAHALTDSGAIGLKVYDRVAGDENNPIYLPSVMTMRSARLGMLKDTGDTQEELIAQYIIYGYISLRHQADDPDPKRTETQLNAKAREFEHVIRDVLDRCVGHIFLSP